MNISGISLHNLLISFDYSKIVYPNWIPLVRNWESEATRFQNFLPEKPFFLLFAVWCLRLLLDSLCLLAACFLVLEHLPDSSTKGSRPRPPPQMEVDLRPPPFVKPFLDGSAGYQAPSITHPAPSSKLAQASCSKHQVSSGRHWETRL